MVYLKTRKRDGFVHECIIVGGGASGFAVLVAALNGGHLDRLLDDGLILIDSGSADGAGHLSQFLINSDSHAESFIRAILGCDFFEDIFDDPVGAAMLARRSEPVPLTLASSFLRLVAARLRSYIDERSPGSILSSTSAISVARTRSGLWRVTMDTPAGNATLLSKAIVLANGGEQDVAKVGDAAIADADLATLASDRLVSSHELLTLPARVFERFAGEDGCQTCCIIGSSHSAMSSAFKIIESDIFRDRWDECITIIHRSPLRLTYQSPEHARQDGYCAFTNADVCQLTGRVFPLAGFRSESRDLARRILGLGTDRREQRIRLIDTHETPPDMVHDYVMQADLVIDATGYRRRHLPFFDEWDNPIPLQGDLHAKSPLVDERSRVLDARGTPLEGVYGIGLSAGFPMAGNFGEASFRGNANGLALWHGQIGAQLVEEIVCLSPAQARSA